MQRGPARPASRCNSPRYSPRPGRARTRRYSIVREEKMATEIGHFIDGKRVAGKSGRTGDVTNPATGEVTGKVAFASEAEIDQAVQIARKAQAEWAATTPVRRQRVVFNLKSLLETTTADSARSMSVE